MNESSQQHQYSYEDQSFSTNKFGFQGSLNRNYLGSKKFLNNGNIENLSRIEMGAVRRPMDSGLKHVDS